MHSAQAYLASAVHVQEGIGSRSRNSLLHAVSLGFNRVLDAFAMALLLFWVLSAFSEFLFLLGFWMLWLFGCFFFAFGVSGA